MSQLAEFCLEDGKTKFLVKVPDVKDPKIQKVSRYGQKIVEAKQSLEQSLQHFQPVAMAVLDKVKGLHNPADEIEVKFGLALSADAGVIFASTGGEVTFEVTLKWSQQTGSDIQSEGTNA